MDTQVAIIGAGISGLAAAYRLHTSGHDVRVFESNAQAGGVIRTHRHDGLLIEEGPNSINGAGPALTRVLHELDLMAARITANPDARNRFVVRNRQPVPIPQSIPDFLRTPLLSARAKARLLTEPFRKRGPSGESLADFVARRLGPEVLDYAVNPFVAGVYGGRPDQLAVQHAFPMLKTLEKKHGSLFVGGLRKALSGSSDNGDAPTLSGLFSFRDGLQTLPNALAAHLSDAVTLDCPVQQIAPAVRGWTLTHADGTTRAESVVYAAPLHRLGDGITLDTPLGLDPLHALPYAPMRSVSLAVPEDAVSHPLDGFGMLVPAAESDLRILGTIFASTLFPDRAPEGQVLLTTFVGGARHPEHMELSPDATEALVQRDLGRLLGLSGGPTYAHHVTWPRAIPQYTAAHGRLLGRLDALETAHPGLHFAGNYRTGISVEDAFDSGWQAAGMLATTHS
ncbi:protoporphyrinogen oxidase [Longimonas halophila]|uniref:Coproporphyrinogen III oxidase n=1 Tax=Longimonas halophila TaxID=1469170 RepID=A0A2H3P6Z3_9BACT|nr:protoporphyrinogen oxidase [Longimonas halophila]PEN06795.1 protoporphyrinogen oxidase [Longimonas halophila]